MTTKSTTGLPSHQINKLKSLAQVQGLFSDPRKPLIQKILEEECDPPYKYGSTSSFRGHKNSLRRPLEVDNKYIKICRLL